MADATVGPALEEAAAGPDLRRARAADLAVVTRLLDGAGLPGAGVSEALGGFVVAEWSGRVVGVAGLEIHGRDGLLRSVAVAEGRRGRGLGGLLTAAALDAARASRLRRVYLLTTTAEGYFRRYGFRRIDRAAVPRRVQRSVEFTEACPATATAMVLELE